MANNDVSDANFESPEDGAGPNLAPPPDPAALDPSLMGTTPPLEIDQGLWPQLKMFGQTLWTSPGKKTLNFLTVGIIVVICATAAAQIRLNVWYRPFYDAIEQRNLAAFWEQLVVFAVIASVLLGLNVAQTWLTQTIKVKTREWMTKDLVAQWLKPRRAFLLHDAGPIGVNPDQRIHEDTRRLTELSAELGIGCFQAALLLLSFIGVLWSLSQEVVFSVDGHQFLIPGYMVWAALLYATVGSWLGFYVGRPLIELDTERYSREANLRFELVRANEHIDGIALYGGEANEQKRINFELKRVLIMMRRVVSKLTQLTWVTAGYGWFAIVFPILVAAPGYFSGNLSFGRLMMVVGAFSQVQMSLRWFVDNFGAIADWRATMRRVMGFRQALIALDKMEGASSRIEFVEHPEGDLAFENLCITSASGESTKLDRAKVEVTAGERVLVIGMQGSSKSTLFRAIAGLWPWGSGRIALPPRQNLWFLPQRPYVQPGLLRDSLLYPSAPSSVDDALLIAAFERTGLEHLVPLLDHVARWDKELGIDEQKRVALARVLLHKPQWVFIDEAIDMLDKDYRQIMFSLFATELKETGVVSFSRHESNGGFYSRILRLVPCAPGELGGAPPSVHAVPPAHAATPTA